MAYDEALAERVRAAIGDEDGLDERKMFGGLAFLVGGHMAVGIVQEELMVRLPPERANGALAEDGVRPMDFTGRPMKGFLFVSQRAVAGEEDLAAWVTEAVAFARSRPPKR